MDSRAASALAVPLAGHAHAQAAQLGPYPTGAHELQLYEAASGAGQLPLGANQSGKRKEKARIAARVRRSQEAGIITEMAHELHITQEKMRRIDKTTIIKLAIDYIKAFELLCRGEPAEPALSQQQQQPPPPQQHHQHQPAQARFQREHSDDEDENNRNRKHHHHDHQQAPPRLVGVHSRKRPPFELQAGRQRAAARHQQHQQHHQHHQHQLGLPLKRPESSHENGQVADGPPPHRQQQQLLPLQRAAADNQQDNRRATSGPPQQQIEPPSISTASIFEPKTTENANSHYLMIEGAKGDGLASFVLKPDTEVLDEDDLTHLAPQAGDVSIPLDVQPLESIVLDDKTSSLFVASPGSLDAGYLSGGSPAAQPVAQVAPSAYCSAATTTLPAYPTAGAMYQPALAQRADNRSLINSHGRHDNYYQ